MPTREQVSALISEGHSYETAARELKISPGLAFMIATGRPPDGSGVPVFNPTRKEHVIEWVKERAARELSHG